MGYAVQPLRGLGALTPQEAQALLTPLMQTVRRGLDELVAEAEEKSAAIASSIKMNWFQRINPFEPSEAEVKAAANDWAQTIVNYATSVRDSLSRKDSSGQPLFVRKPDDSERILQTAKRDLTELINDYREAAESTTFIASVNRIIDLLIQTILQIAQIVVQAIGRAIAKFPLGALAIGGGALLVTLVYLKVMRII